MFAFGVFPGFVFHIGGVYPRQRQQNFNRHGPRDQPNPQQENPLFMLAQTVIPLLFFMGFGGPFGMLYSLLLFVAANVYQMGGHSAEMLVPIAFAALLILSAFSTEFSTFWQPQSSLEYETNDGKYPRQPNNERNVGPKPAVHEMDTDAYVRVALWLILASFWIGMVFWGRIYRWLLRVLPQPLGNMWRSAIHRSGLAPDTPSRGSIPASKKAVSELNEITLEEKHFLQAGGPLLSCAICLENYHLKESGIYQFPCKHLFHKACVLPWLKKHNSCPTCRYELVTDDPDYEEARRQRETERLRTQQETNNIARMQQNNSGQVNATRNTTTRNVGGNDRGRLRNRIINRMSRFGNFVRNRFVRNNANQVNSQRRTVQVPEHSNLVQLRSWLESQSLSQLLTIARQRNLDMTTFLEKKDVVDAILRSTRS